MSRRAFFLFAVAALLALWAGARAYPPIRHPIDSFFLAQALFAEGEESLLARRSLPPSRSEAETAEGPLDLYLPGEAAGAARPRGCILLAHGMTDLGRRDPRLAAFARNLARLGFAAAVPGLTGMRRFRPERKDVDRVAAGFAWLDKNYGRDGRCGVFAFSFAAGPALMAAARPGARDRVSYLVAFGPYFDLRAVLRHMTTGGRSGEPAMPGGPPLRAGKWIFLRQNPDLLGLAGYEAEAAEIARRKLIDEDAGLAPFRARLPGSARRVLGLMENRDPDRFDELYEAQDLALREQLGAWSLREVIPRIRAPLYILHGRADPFIPPEESVRLATAARRRGTGAVCLLILEGFLHVDPGAGARALTWSQAAGVLRFLGFISEVLTAMEGG